MAKKTNALGDDHQLLKPGEVAEIFRVDTKTVARWAKDGRINSVRTLGGHRRYLVSEVRRLINMPSD